MTKRVVGHLKHRLRIIKKEISNLKYRIQSSTETIKIAENELFAFKVEATAITHALREWDTNALDELPED